MSRQTEDHTILHDQIWAAIDRLAKTFVYSPSGLAKQAGLDPTSFNKSKRTNPDGKPRWPSTESIARVLGATGATMSEFLSLMDQDVAGSFDGLSNAVPMIGFAQAGTQGLFDEDGYPSGDAWDHIPFPSTEAIEDGAYALEISGESMQPLYREGDKIIVSPSATIRKGDRVVIKTVSGEVMAKELTRQTKSKIELKSLNDDFAPRTIGIEDISWMARILWVSQ